MSAAGAALGAPFGASLALRAAAAAASSAALDASAASSTLSTVLATSLASSTFSTTLVAVASLDALVTLSAATGNVTTSKRPAPMRRAGSSFHAVTTPSLMAFQVSTGFVTAVHSPFAVSIGLVTMVQTPFTVPQSPSTKKPLPTLLVTS